MSKQSIQNLTITSIMVEENVRIGDDTKLQIAELAADIATNGLQDHLEVCELKDEGGVLILARGHRRLAAIKRLQTVNPEAYQTQFAGGIPCLVNKNSNRTELLERKADHGNMLQLSEWFELLQSVQIHKKLGLGQKDIVTKVAGVMDQIQPMKPGKSKEFSDLRVQIAGFEESKDHGKAGELKGLYDQKLFDYRRGMIQGLILPCECPDIVIVALRKAADGTVDERFKNVELPVLRANDIKKLRKAFKKDEDEMVDGVSKWNKRKPGPSFEQAWNEVLVETKQRESQKANGKKADKAMSAKDIKESAKDLLSRFGRNLAAHHAGSKEIDYAEVLAFDELVYKFELVAEHDTGLLDKVIKTAEKIEAEVQKDATVEAETTEVEATT